MIVTRRTFLTGLSAATAGLALGLPRAHATRIGAPRIVWTANPYLQIGNDGIVHVWCHRSEMGQGIRSSLPVVIADELGADPAKIELHQGDGDEKYLDQDTDGSSSIRRQWDPLRAAAATARAMLVTAAAQRWKVPEARLTVHDDAVHDGKRALAFAELVVAAAKLPVPKTAPLRDLKDLPHLGKDLPQLDAPDQVSGVAKYGADLKLPGMLTAVIARPPALFGKAAAFDPKRALATPGVRKVVELPAPKPPINTKPLGGIAVIADHTWAAIKGRAVLDVTWDGGVHGAHDSATFATQLLTAVRTPGETVRTLGDATAALAKAAKVVEAEYTTSYLAHATMEPPAAVAQVTGTKCEVWAPTQNPIGVRDQIADTLGLAKPDITVHVTLLGGGFGRKGFPDFAVEAAQLSRAAGAPVRVQWTRDDDLRHSSYHAQSAQAFAAGLDDHGKLVAWRHRLAYPSIMSTFDGTTDRPQGMELGMGVVDLPLATPNVRVEIGVAPAHMRIGWLRSVANIHQAFAIQSFIAELAHAARRDPREMLLDVLGPARTLTAADQGVKSLWNYGEKADKHPIDVGRLRSVIDKVTQMAAWDKGGRALGLAAHRSFASYIAMVAHVTKGKRDELRVEEVWIAADVGTVINGDRVRYQLEGGFLYGLFNALHGAITVKNGAVVQRNFRDYKILRMPQAPRAIHVELLPSTAPPGGVGEPGTPPAAPAVANAWFALTGTRLRAMPFVL